MRQCEFVVSHFLTAQTEAWHEAEERRNAEGEKAKCRNEPDVVLQGFTL